MWFSKLLLCVGLAAGTLSMWLLLKIGTALRTRREEALLRRTFGAAYDHYARRVPPLVPGLRIG